MRANTSDAAATWALKLFANFEQTNMGIVCPMNVSTMGARSIANAETFSSRGRGTYGNKVRRTMNWTILKRSFSTVTFQWYSMGLMFPYLLTFLISMPK